MPITFQGDPSANELVLDFDYNTASTGATGGSGSWTFVIPSNARTLSIIAVAGGSGGGAGRCGATNTDRSGGGGGTSIPI